MPNAHKRKFSNYLLDKKLQLRYVVFVTVLSALICGTLGYLIWQQDVEATQTIEAQMANDPEMAAVVIGSLESKDQNLVLTMAGTGIGLVIVLSFFLLMLTHKVAGPLFKVTLYFDKMRDGRLDQVWPLRKGDMLQTFYDKFRSMHLVVRARHSETNDAIKLFVELSQEHIETNGEQGHRLEELRKHTEQRTEALT